MTSRRTLLALAVSSVLPLGGLAQTIVPPVLEPGRNLISGWDFNGGNTAALIVGGEIEPRYSDLRKDSNLSGNAVAVGSGLFLNGTGGSSAWTINVATGAAIATNTVDQSPDIPIGTPARTTPASGGNPTGLFGVDLGDISGIEGALQLQTRTSGGLTGNDAFAILVDTRQAKDLDLFFSHRLQGTGSGTGSIAWSYKVGSGPVVSTGIVTSIATGTTTYSQEIIDFSGFTAMNFVEQLYIIGTVTQSALGRPILLDNIGIRATTGITSAPPAFTSAASATFLVGTPGSFTVTASGDPAPTFAVTPALPTGLSLNTTSGVISGTPAAATGGAYTLTLTATNSGGSVDQSFTLTVNEAPAIGISGPTSVNLGATATYTATVTGFPVPSVAWRKGGTPNGSTGTSFAFTAAETSGGTYDAVATNVVSSADSNDITLAVVLPPVITSPATAQGVTGRTFSYTVTATGAGPITFGATGLPTGLGINTTTGVISGTTTVAGVAAVTLQATNAAGTTQLPLSLDVVAASSLRTKNLSSRVEVRTGNEVAIAGVVIEGSSPKRLLIRAVGPALGGAPFNIANPLADPTLLVFSGSTVTASNDDWGTAPNAAEIVTTSAAVGAFALAEGSTDAVILADFAPGIYTFHASGKDGGTGIALIEVYEVDTNGRLVNLSTRSLTATGDAITIGGFVIDGTAPKRVLVRGIGESLNTLFSVEGVLANPRLEIFSGSTSVASNDNWGSAGNVAEIQATTTLVGAFDLPSTTTQDAVLLLDLPPGAYTAQVSGVGGTTGITLLEIYEVP